jgi:hypothetical protein
MARRDGVWLAAMASMVLGAACGGADTPAGPTHTTHAMVGTYALAATFPTFRPDVRQPATEASDAALTGTLVVGDTVEVRDAAQTFFPDVRFTDVLCTRRGVCDAPESYASFTSLFLPQRVVTFGFSSTGGGRTLHFDGPFVGDSVAGTAWVQVGTSRYDGTFVARKQR